MRHDFSSETPRLDQLMRVSQAKKPGRKHRKTAPNRCKQNQANTLRRRNALNSLKRMKYIEKVKSYWAGNLEEFPVMTETLS